MTEPEITVENITQALHQLYSVSSTESRDVAQRWLSTTQRSKQAWHFSWELLKAEKPTEVQYYGASALLSRIQQGFPDEVSEDDLPLLRNHLLELLLRFSADSSRKVVLTRICVAFSHFLFKSFLNNMWPNAIQELINLFKVSADSQNNSFTDEQCFSALINLLTIIPEEHQTNKLDPHSLSITLNMLKSEFVHVIQCLQIVKQQESSVDIKIKTIKCLKSWISIGVPILDCKDMLIIVSSYLNQAELFEACVECLICAFSSPTSYSFPNTIKEFVPVVLSLRPMLDEAIKTEDGASVQLLTRLVCSLAENQTKLILTTLDDPSFGLSLIWMVMDCTRVPLQYPICEFSSPITYTFWYTIQDDMLLQDQEELAVTQKKLYPIFCTLAHEILIKASYPTTESYSQFTADEKEQFRIFRIDISDTLMYMFSFLGVGLLEYTFTRFKIALNQRNENRNVDKPWQEVEAYLFGMYSLLEVVSEYNVELPMLPEFASILPSIVVESDYEAETLLYTIGTMVEWLSVKPQYLQPLVALLLPYLLHDNLRIQAILTLKRLTSECGCHMLSYGSDIMQQIRNVLNRGVLNSVEEGSLMQCAGYVLSEMQMSDCVKTLEELLMAKLHRLKDLASEEPSVASKTSIVNILYLLSNLFQTLHLRENSEQVTQPAVVILQQLTDIFKDILNRWAGDSDVVFSLCTLYDKSIRNLLTKSQEIITDLCEMLTKIFQVQPHPQILDLAQRIITIFTDNKPSVIGSFIQCLSRSTLQLFKNNYYLQNPDVPQYFYRLMSMVVRKQPQLLKYSDEQNAYVPMSELFHCGLLTLDLLDSESVKSASSFFSDFLLLGTRDKEIENSVSLLGCRLVEASLRAIGGVGPRSTNQNFADILFSIASTCRSDYLKWMEQFQARHDIPCMSIDPQVKKILFQSLCKELRHKRRFRDLVDRLSLTCRGMVGSEYARATTR